jgi:hypothetical protein
MSKADAGHVDFLIHFTQKPKITKQFGVCQKITKKSLLGHQLSQFLPKGLNNHKFSVHKKRVNVYHSQLVKGNKFGVGQLGQPTCVE